MSFDIEKYKEETPFAKNTAFFDYFDAALEELVARWVHDTGNYRQIDEQKGALVIFVDDLDRCLPEKTVQVLEAIKLFLDKHGCVFVLGADSNVVRSAVRDALPEHARSRARPPAIIWRRSSNCASNCRRLSTRR